ncbi:hypothetical protein [Niabella ginsengisoli]|uniref:Major facilitator superfamily (MFS) profile domain-containing protein n=1 Tax=Niabella ginsengisoli TaxID=522298 RepID=A0ABS9SKT7_9BACT|nr:hypothetical protein [Niabella ginsengisoli]MCH5598955.1 hypothetical protein [Niabella ginsengisoli]
MEVVNKKSSVLLITLVVSLGGFLFGFDMAVVSGVLPFYRKNIRCRQWLKVGLLRSH